MTERAVPGPVTELQGATPVTGPAASASVSEPEVPGRVGRAEMVGARRSRSGLRGPRPERFAARTVLLPRQAGGSIDPVTVATSAPDGFLLQGARGSVAGSGIAARLELAQGLQGGGTGSVARWLAAVPAGGLVGRPASGPIAFAALPFSPGAAAVLHVPAVTVVRAAGGDTWVTVVGPSPLTDAAVGRALSCLGHLDGDAPGDTAADHWAPDTAADHWATDAGADERASDAGRREAASHSAASHSADSHRPSAAGAPHTSAGGGRRPSDGADPVPEPPLHVDLWPDEAGFEAMVRRALAAIATGRISKVVLARQVAATFGAPLDHASVLRRLRLHEPTCAVFAQRIAGQAFVGASPELLVRRRGEQVWSHPLAGTAPLRPSLQAAAAALSAPKEQAEHRAAAMAVVERLSPWCSSLDVPDGPSLVRLATVVHLGTRLSGRLRQGPGGTAAPDALSLAAVLHPTPAVAGVPTAEALDCIAELETAGRGPYAGPVGWMDGRGDGDWLVAIRSASLDGPRAVAYAGAGIVAGSDPAHELRETTLKLRTALGAIWPDDPPVTSEAAAG